MPYSPPAWNAADIEFSVGYTIPAHDLANIDFVEVDFQAITVSGISAGAFGDPVIVPGEVYITAAGAISESALGDPTVFNSLQYVTATGIASAEAFGTPTVYNLTQYLSPSAIAGGAFGTASIYSTTRWIYGDGFEQTQVGHPTVENANKTLYPDGFTGWAFGTASVFNNTRYVYAQRFDESAFGTAQIIGARYISAAGAINGSAVGGHALIGPQRILGAGFNALVMNPPVVSNATRYLVPSGMHQGYTQVGPGGSVVFSIGNNIYPESIDPPYFFEPIIGNDPYSVIECSGIDESAFGDLDVDQPASSGRIYNRGIDAGAFGTPRLNPVQLRPAGLSAGAIGTARISNWNRYVRPGGVTGIKFGTQFVSNYTRYVGPTGFDKSVVWDDFGPIDMDGIRAMVFNVNTVVSPIGAEWGAFGEPTLTQQC